MYFYLEIHQVSTKYRSKYDIFPISFYCTQHNHSNYKFYSNFTKLDLAKSAKVKVQNTVKTFHELELQNQQTPVVLQLRVNARLNFYSISLQLCMCLYYLLFNLQNFPLQLSYNRTIDNKSF